MIQRSTLVRIAIFLATVMATTAILTLGTGQETTLPAVGMPANQPYYADEAATVIDVDATEQLQEDARQSVEPPREVDTEVETTVLDDIQAVFEDLQALVVSDEEPAEAEIPALPPEETTTTAAEGEEGELPPAQSEPALLSGAVFIDVDGDGVFNTETGEDRMDAGVPGIGVEVQTHDDTYTVNTNDQGTWEVEFAGGPAVVVVDVEDPELPDGYQVSTENVGQLVECAPGDVCEIENVGLGVTLRELTEVVDTVTASHALDEEPVVYLARVAADDVVREALGEPLHLPTIQEAAVQAAQVQFASRIEPEQLRDAQANVSNNPPFVFHPDTGLDPEGSDAAAEIVASNLQANYRINEELWEERQAEAANEVEAVEVSFSQDELIVDQGELVTAIHVAAIEETTTPTIVEQPWAGLMAVVVVLVTLLGVYLATFRPEFWSRPRMVALLGITIVLAAGAVRGTVALQGAFGDAFSWYVLPAVAFGFITAVLFDQRIAILMALSVGVLTAVGTLDIGATVYGILAALAPIPFVSAVSSRGSFRNAVILSSVGAAVVAAATSWFFHVGPDQVPMEVVPISVAWAFGVSVLASLLGLAALQFFESAFDITTTLGLLDLTDRNHEALQMLQEEAFGTFNHSLMVGTLADAAARAISANALLARAMAYYHDLGKTAHPTFFIENQFGMTNPHDELDPKESAQIIRDHVSAGVALAREYKIPTDVTEGIVSHHGDGVMRYFYEKARQEHGDDVDIDDFRHVGHKPRTAETAILMLADSLEAACRAVFQTEEPTGDAIEKVVDRVMNEKMEDGQLSEAPLTMGEITKIRRAFLDSLTGHYHQRIAYPNFPGS